MLLQDTMKNVARIRKNKQINNRQTQTKLFYRSVPKKSSKKITTKKLFNVIVATVCKVKIEQVQ